MSNRVRGKVKTYNDKRGFGFISRPGEEDIFVHITELEETGDRILYPGDEVSFEVGKSEKDGRSRAERVRVQVRAS